MKKFICAALALLICLGLPLMVYAKDVTTCVVTADSVPTPPGEQITIPVRITENQGFTNFAISLEYDAEKLQLISIDTADGENAYLCGAQTAVNTNWNNKSYGYIVSASADAVIGDGILFTATFQTMEDFKDFTTVIPVVRYIRNNAAVFSVFEEIVASVTASAVTAVVSGDLTGDGIVEYDDVMLVYKASLGEETLTDEQKLRADLNGDQIIDTADAEAIYQIYTGG